MQLHWNKKSSVMEEFQTLSFSIMVECKKLYKRPLEIFFRKKCSLKWGNHHKQIQSHSREILQSSYRPHPFAGVLEPEGGHRGQVPPPSIWQSHYIEVQVPPPTFLSEASLSAPPLFEAFRHPCFETSCFFPSRVHLNNYFDLHVCPFFCLQNFIMK